MSILEDARDVVKKFDVDVKDPLQNDSDGLYLKCSRLIAIICGTHNMTKRTEKFTRKDCI